MLSIVTGDHRVGGWKQEMGKVTVPQEKGTEHRPLREHWFPWMGGGGALLALIPALTGLKVFVGVEVLLLFSRRLPAQKPQLYPEERSVCSMFLSTWMSASWGESPLTLAFLLIPAQTGQGGP